MRRREGCNPRHKANGSALDRIKTQRNRKTAETGDTDATLQDLCPGFQTSQLCLSLPGARLSHLQHLLTNPRYSWAPGRSHLGSHFRTSPVAPSVSWVRPSGRRACSPKAHSTPGRPTVEAVSPPPSPSIWRVGGAPCTGVPPSCWALSNLGRLSPPAPTPASSNRRRPAPAPLLPPPPLAEASNVAPLTAHAQYPGRAGAGGAGRGGRSDATAQPRAGGAAPRRRAAPAPPPGGRGLSACARPRRPTHAPPSLPALTLARTFLQAREHSTTAVQVPLKPGRTMSSPPEGKLETKAGHPPAGTDSFPLSLLSRARRAGSNPRARGAERGARSGAPGGGGSRPAWDVSARGV